MDFTVKTSEAVERKHSVWLGLGEVQHLLAKVVADRLHLDLTSPNVSYEVTLRAAPLTSEPDTQRIFANVVVVEDVGPVES